MDEDYPEKFKHCFDCPILLFQRGNIDLHKKRIIIIVGTRNATSHRIEFCEQFIKYLEPLDPVIISGFAYGIDITAQRTAINHNLQTVGCLAHGLNQIYPKVHFKYMKSVEENGGFFTDFWSTDAFDHSNFLKRKRIIAGLSEVTIVIESAEKGGSLVTADIPNSYDRKVLAVPGRPADLLSRGCNELIKRQQAHVLTSAADLISMFNWQPERKENVVQKRLSVELEDDEKVLFKFLQEMEKNNLI